MNQGYEAATDTLEGQPRDGADDPPTSLTDSQEPAIAHVSLPDAHCSARSLEFLKGNVENKRGYQVSWNK